jgi:hypothetical protein
MWFTAVFFNKFKKLHLSICVLAKALFFNFLLLLYLNSIFFASLKTGVYISFSLVKRSPQPQKEAQQKEMWQSKTLEHVISIDATKLFNQV